MVFYFTGTGNSLYIARQIEENPVSIPQIIHSENQEYSADSIGIVAPVYGHEVPAMVKEFLKNAVFHTDYFYMILTYGNRHGGAAELAKKLCDECGIAVHYINVILMADNWLRNLRKSVSDGICAGNGWKSGTYAGKLSNLSGLRPCLSAKGNPPDRPGGESGCPLSE